MELVKTNRSLLQAGIVFLVAVILYSNTANHDYAWDDAIVLTTNSRVQKGLSDIPELFENIKSEKTENRYGYRPFALLSFATDVELFGMDPAASHKVNILFYGLLCALIFVFLNSFFPLTNAPWAVFAVTLLFVVHPLHTEVVSNIKSRDEILALMFGLGALLSLRKALLSGKFVWFVVMAILLLLSFTSKESGITFCGAALLVPFYVKPEKSWNWKRIAIGVAAAVVSLAVLLALRKFVYSEAFFQTNDWDLIYKGVFIQDGFVGNPLWDATLENRIATALYLVIYGVYRFFSPLPLIHDYSYNVFPVRTWNDVEVYAGTVFTVLLIGAALHGVWKRKAYGFGLMFYLITTSIYLHLVHIGPDIFAERYLFVPSLGICVALLSFFNLKKPGPKVVLITVLVVCIPFFVISRKRNEVWKDNQTLLTADIGKLENCARANYNYALYLHNDYYELPVAKQVDAQKELLGYYERALEITDRVFKVYMDLGAAYMEFGFPQKGYDVFVEATEKYPVISTSYVQLGKFFISFNEYGKAIPYFEKAIQYGSANSTYYYLKGFCEYKAGATEEAITTLQQGEQFEIQGADYHALFASIYLASNDTASALDALQRGYLLFPDSPVLQEVESRIEK